MYMLYYTICHAREILISFLLYDVRLCTNEFHLFRDSFSFLDQLNNFVANQRPVSTHTIFYIQFLRTIFSWIICAPVTFHFHQWWLNFYYWFIFLNSFLPFYVCKTLFSYAKFYACRWFSMSFKVKHKNFFCFTQFAILRYSKFTLKKHFLSNAEIYACRCSL